MDKKLFALVAVIMLILATPQAFAAEYKVDLTLSSSFVRAGPCSGGTMIKATVTNDGDTSDTYSLEPQNNWIMIQPSTLTLDAGQSREIAIFMTPPCDTEPKEYQMDITAKSSKAQDTETVTIDVIQVYGVEIETPATKTACYDDTEVFDIEISNTGKDTETYAVTATKGTLDKQKVSIDSGETATVKLSIPVTADKITSQVTVKSESSYAQATGTVQLMGTKCYSEEISIAPESKTSCIEEASEFMLTIRNTGTKTEQYEISADLGELSTETLTVNAGEEKKLKLTITAEDAGVYTSNIRIKSAHAEKTMTAQVSAQSCKGVAIISIPKEKTVCRGDTATYFVTAKNTGKTEDELAFTTTMGTLSDTKATLKAGDTKELTLDIPTKGLEGDEYTVTVTAESDIKDTTESRLIIEDCYASKIRFGEDTAEVCPNKEATFSLTLENTGKNTDTYKLKTEYGTLSDTEVELEAGETKDITLSAVSDKDRKIEITIESAAKETTATATLTMKGESECYGFEIDLNPETIEANQYKGYLYTITIRNTGEYTAEFKTEMTSGPEWVFIDPKTTTIGQKTEGNFYVYASPPYGTQEGTYSITIKVTRDGETSKTVKAKMILNPEGKDTVPVIIPDEEDETETDVTPDTEGTEDEPGNETEDEAEEEPKEPSIYKIPVDTEKVFEIKPNTTDKFEGTVTIEGKEDTIEINFKTGSFIMEIGSAKIEDENPELGEITYELEEDGKKYTVTVEFTEVNTTSDEYKFKLIDMEVTEIPAGEKTPTGDVTETQAPVSRNLIYAAIAGLIIIILILFGPEIADSTKKFFGEEKKEEKEEEPTEEKEPTAAPAKKTEGMPLEEIKGIGGKRAEALRKAGIKTVDDLAEANITDIMSEAVTSEKQAKDLIKKAKRLVKKQEKDEKESEKQEKKEEEKKKDEPRKEVRDDIKDILESI